MTLRQDTVWCRRMRRSRQLRSRNHLLYDQFFADGSKKEIEPMDSACEVILALKPVTFLFFYQER